MLSLIAVERDQAAPCPELALAEPVGLPPAGSRCPEIVVCDYAAISAQLFDPLQRIVCGPLGPLGLLVLSFAPLS